MLATVNIEVVFISVTKRVSKGFAGRQEERGGSKITHALPLKNTRSLNSEARIPSQPSPLALSSFLPMLDMWPKFQM